MNDKAYGTRRVQTRSGHLFRRSILLPQRDFLSGVDLVEVYNLRSTKTALLRAKGAQRESASSPPGVSNPAPRPSSRCSACTGTNRCLCFSRTEISDCPSTHVLGMRWQNEERHAVSRFGCRGPAFQPGRRAGRNAHCKQRRGRGRNLSWSDMHTATSDTCGCTRGHDQLRRRNRNNQSDECRVVG